MLLVLTFILSLTQISALTGSQASAYCHCNLTPSFCDFDCCCDTDCSSSITSECFNSNSKAYCPDSTFFARLGSSYLNSQGCFYYNSSNTVLDQITLTNSQITNIINNQESVNRLASSSASTRAGYQIGDQLNIGSSTTFTFVQSDGSCLTSTTAGVTTFQLKFGLNMRLSCRLSSSTLPLLFSSFSGQNLSQFKGDTTKTANIPSFSDSSLTSVDMRIIIGSYGSDSSRYIERVTISTSNSASSQRSLNIWFVQPSELQSLSSASSFFPQIPSDMFYPIYLLS